jgi:hypothetical protein
MIFPQNGIPTEFHLEQKRVALRNRFVYYKSEGIADIAFVKDSKKICAFRNLGVLWHGESSISIFSNTIA